MFRNRKKSLGAKSGANTVGTPTIRTTTSRLQQHRCARVHCLDERELFSLPNGGVFSWFICPAGLIMTHNILHFSLVLFLSNKWRWFRSHPKRPFPSPCLPISLFSPSSGLVYLMLSTVSSVPSSQACKSGSKFHQQWCTDAEIQWDCDEKALN